MAWELWSATASLSSSNEASKLYQATLHLCPPVRSDSLSFSNLCKRTLRSSGVGIFQNSLRLHLRGCILNITKLKLNTTWAKTCLQAAVKSVLEPFTVVHSLSHSRTVMIVSKVQHASNAAVVSLTKGIRSTGAALAPVTGLRCAIAFWFCNTRLKAY